MSGLVIAGLVLVSLFAVLLNGFFAGCETGFVSADRIRIRYLAEEENDPRAAKIMRHLENPDRMLTTVLVGTNIALIVGTMAITKQAGNPWVATLIATPLFLVFAEVVPKSVFRRHPEWLSLKLYPLIRFFDLLLRPMVLPAMWGLYLMRVVTRSTGEVLNPIMATEEDLRNLVDESAARGSIEPEEREMIHSVMDLQSISAKEIMVPRIDIDALPDTATRSELIALFEATGRTRIPIYHETIDSVIGVANVYDVLLDIDGPEDNIVRFANDVTHVPDTAPVDDLLQQMKRSGHHVAIVADEYGGTDGLLTLEDVLEEIFGEIEDEHDVKRDMILRVGPHAYVVDARMTLDDFSEEINVAIVDEEVETVGGWVMHGAGRIPAQGERLEHDGFRITILEGGVSRLSKIRLDILPERRESSEEEL